MILFVVGLPGRFAQWCEAALVRLAGRGVASETWPSLTDMFGYDGIPSTFDELGRALIGNRGEHLVIGARQPDARLRGALAERNTPFLLALDDPHNAVSELLAETGVDPKAVVRAVANSCPMVMQFDGLPGTLAIHADHARLDPAAAVSAIARHFGIAVEPEAAAAIADDLTTLGAGSESSGAAEPAEHLPAETRKMIEGALLGYRHFFANGRLGQIVWTRDLFHLAVDAARSPTEPIDVAGGSRILIYGPYIHLPPGSWSARVVLGFSPETVHSRFLVDVYSDTQLACTTLQPEASGVYSADLAFSLAEPSGKGVEVRVTVANDDARGKLAFGRVVLQRHAMRRPDALAESEDFASVLDL